MGFPRCFLMDQTKEAREGIGKESGRLHHVAIDEAHCVPEWGESFRPAYLGLGAVLAALRPPAATAFTATASPSILEAMSRFLFGDDPWTLVEGDPDRPNIAYAVRRSLARERSLETLLRELPRPTIVFAGSRKATEILAERFQRRLGCGEIRFYHAGLLPAEKRALEAWFYSSKDGILMSTCAYGMGVDKKDIRTVIHYDPPPSIEAYLQESGRAGRDGKAAAAVLVLGTEADRGVCREGDPLRRARREALLNYGRDSRRCRREALLAMLGSELRSPCTGCDVCSGKAESGIEGEAQISAFARGNPRRYDTAGALRLLLGKGGEPPACAASGGLDGWRQEDAAAALRAASDSGMIRFAEKGLWKGRLIPRSRCSPRLRLSFPWLS